MAATAADMVEFWHALLGGKLLSPQTVRDQFQRLYPMFDKGTYYGRGVMLYDVPDKDGGHLTWLGHSGSAPGLKAVVAYSVEAKAFVSVALNNDGSAEATANLLLKAVSQEPCLIRIQTGCQFPRDETLAGGTGSGSSQS